MDDHTFLGRVAGLLRCDRRRAEAITSVVFQELRARLTAEEASDVAAQLPPLLEGLWNEQPDDYHPPKRIRLPEFIGRVRRRAALPDDADAERSIKAVFHSLQRLLGSPHGTEGEAWHVFALLPKGIKALWLQASDPGSVAK